jgi:hypothetical protein
MSSRYAVLAIPLALGLACSHAKTQSSDHTGAMWTESNDNTVGTPAGNAAAAQGDQAQPVTVAATGSGEEQSGSSATGGSQNPSGSSDMGSQGSGSGGPATGPMGESQAGGSTGSSSGGSPEAQPHGKSVSGKITAVSPEEVTIAPKSGHPVTLQISTDTKVMANGKSADVSKLKQGQWVKASYAQHDGSTVATKIDLGKSHHHAKAPSSGSSGQPSGGTGTGSPSGGGSNQ